MADEDITAAIVSYLDGLMTGTTVATQVPDPRPPQLVIVRLIGWPKLPPVRRIARVVITGWGADITDEAGAMDLGIEARGHINALIGTEGLGAGLAVYGVEESLGLHQTADPLTKVPQAEATYAIKHRADDAIR